jgi:hypothetical protein
LFWYSAIIFFLAGSIHQLMLPLNSLLVTGLAIVPSLLFFGVLVVNQKPTSQEGAAEADKLLGANSLLVSAWEICRLETDIGGTGKLLLDRCETRLAEWSRPVRPLPSRLLQPSGLIASTLALVGLIFLLQPSQLQFETDPDEIAGALPVITSQEADRAVDSLAELLDSNPNPPSGLRAQTSGSTAASLPDPAQAAAQIEQSTTMAGIAANPVEDELADSPTNGPTSEYAGATPALVSSSTPGLERKSGAKSTGNEAADKSNANPIQPGEFDQIQQVIIEADSDHRSLAGDTENQGNRLLASKPEQTALPQSASSTSRQISATGYTYTLSPQQRNLVWRYLVQLEKIDDPK